MGIHTACFCIGAFVFNCNTCLTSLGRGSHPRGYISVHRVRLLKFPFVCFYNHCCKIFLIKSIWHLNWLQTWYHHGVRGMGQSPGVQSLKLQSFFTLFFFLWWLHIRTRFHTMRVVPIVFNGGNIILAAPPTEGRQIGLPLVSVPPLTVPVPVGVRVGVRNDIYFKISPRVLNLGLSY